MQFTKLNDGKGQVKVTGLDAQPRYLNRDNYSARIAPNNTLQIVQNSSKAVVIQEEYSNITQPTSSNLEELCDTLNGEGFFDGSKGGGGNELNQATRQGNMLVADDSFSWVETNNISVVELDATLFGGGPVDKLISMGFSTTPLPLTPTAGTQPTSAILNTLAVNNSIQVDSFLVNLATTKLSAFNNDRYVDPNNDYVTLALRSNDYSTGLSDFKLATYVGGTVHTGVILVNDFNRLQLFANNNAVLELTSEGAVFNRAIQIGQKGSTTNPYSPQGNGTVSLNTVTNDLEVELDGEQKSLTGKKTIQNVGSGSTSITKDTDLVFVTTTEGTAVLNLPLGSTLEEGKEMKFIDTGNATTNNISIVPNGTDNINKVNSSISISSNYGFVILIWDGAQWINIS